jgi:hypothetical protein
MALKRWVFPVLRTSCFRAPFPFHTTDLVTAKLFKGFSFPSLKAKNDRLTGRAYTRRNPGGKFSLQLFQTSGRSKVSLLLFSFVILNIAQYMLSF